MKSYTEFKYMSMFYRKEKIRRRIYMEERIIKDINDLLTQLFQKMHDAGYELDAEKKQLKKIEQKPVQETEPTPIFRVGDTLKRKGKDYTFIVDRIQGGYYHCDHSNGAFFPIEEQDNWELIEQSPPWSEEDEHCMRNGKAIKSC